MDPQVQYVLETRFPTINDPKAKPMRSHHSLDRATLKAHTMLAYLEGLGWEIDGPEDGGPTTWKVAKLVPDGYIIGSLSIFEREDA